MLGIGCAATVTEDQKLVAVFYYFVNKLSQANDSPRSGSQTIFPLL